MNKNRTEWVMHVWGKKRDTLELNQVEKFHLDMLKTFRDQQKKFDRILVNIAIDDVNDLRLFEFLKKEIGSVLVNDNVEFRYCQNDPVKGEYVTFRPYVFDRIGEDVDIFYSHFKGYGSCIRVYKESFPRRVVDLCEMFWTYIMYNYSLNMKDVEKNLKKNSTYGWYMMRNKEDRHCIGFYDDYHNCLQEGDERFKECVADDLHKHYPGSFAWYNMKNIGKSLKDKPLITSVTDEYLLRQSVGKDVGLCTHFCEVYLMNFLKEDECYSVNDFDEQLHNMSNTMYTELYPAKTVAREHLKGFEKYLIENGLI